MAQYQPDSQSYLALDGKTLRGSGTEETPALHLLSVFCEQLGKVLTQRCTSSKPLGHKRGCSKRRLLTQLSLDFQALE